MKAGFDVDRVSDAYGRLHGDSQVSYTGRSNLSTTESMGVWFLQNKVKLLILVIPALLTLLAVVALIGVVMAHPIITAILAILSILAYRKVTKRRKY